MALPKVDAVERIAQRQDVASQERSPARSA
jgi:hypothetical protein